LDLEEDEDSG